MLAKVSPTKAASGTNVCPCCGQPVDTSDLLVSLDANAASRHGVIVRLEPQSAVVLHMLKKQYPALVPFSSIISAMYGLREPLSEDPHKVLKVRVSHLRKTLAPLGVTIENAVYKGGYRLQFDVAP